jgi:hypothetical protein
MRHTAVVLVAGCLLALTACSETSGPNQITGKRTLRLTATSPSRAPIAFTAEVTGDQQFRVSGSVSSTASFSQEFETPGCRTTGPVQVCLASATATQTNPSQPWTVCLEGLDSGGKQCDSASPTAILIINR